MSDPASLNELRDPPAGDNPSRSVDGLNESGLFRLHHSLRKQVEDITGPLDAVLRTHEILDLILSPQMKGKPYRVVLHKKSRAAALIIAAMDDIMKNRDVRHHIDAIGYYHPELAQKIQILCSGSFREMAEIQDGLRKYLHEGNISALLDLSRRGNEYVQQIEAEYGKKPAQRFQELHSKILNNEPEFLAQLGQKVAAWDENLKHYDDQTHTQVAAWWLRGYVQGTDRKRGIRSYKDADLVMKLGVQQHVRELLRYQEQLAFVHGMIKAVQATKEAERESWHEALEMWHHMPRYIARARSYFGNEQLAQSLEQFSKKVHDEPDKWLAELQDRLRELYDPEYQQQFVIHKVQEELQLVFKERMEELQKERARKVRDLIAFFSKLLSRKRKIIGKRLEKMKAAVREEAITELVKHREVLLPIFRKMEETYGSLEKTDQPLDGFGNWIHQTGDRWGKHRIYQMQSVRPLTARWESAMRSGRGLVAFFRGLRPLHQSINTTTRIEDTVTNPVPDPRFQNILSIPALPLLASQVKAARDALDRIMPAYLFTAQEAMEHNPDSLLQWKTQGGGTNG
ncbi:MAG: hypothetical protein V1735_02305 [Nanoarchaeota archaeon]